VISLRKPPALRPRPADTALLAAYAVVGERRQGTLEPVLTMSLRREEFLLGKALAALCPSNSACSPASRRWY